MANKKNSTNKFKTELTEVRLQPKRKISLKGNNDAGKHNGKQKLNNNSSAIDSIDIIESKLLLNVLTEVKNGNFNVRMPKDEIGINGKISDTLNEIIELNEKMMIEFT